MYKFDRGKLTTFIILCGGAGWKNEIKSNRKKAEKTKHTSTQPVGKNYVDSVDGMAGENEKFRGIHSRYLK